MKPTDTTEQLPTCINPDGSECGTYSERSFAHVCLPQHGRSVASHRSLDEFNEIQAIAGLPEGHKCPAEKQLLPYGCPFAFSASQPFVVFAEQRLALFQTEVSRPPTNILAQFFRARRHRHAAVATRYLLNSMFELRLVRVTHANLTADGEVASVRRQKLNSYEAPVFLSPVRIQVNSILTLLDGRIFIVNGRILPQFRKVAFDEAKEWLKNRENAYESLRFATW